MEKFYNENYKKLFLVPIILLLISLLIILNFYQKTGDIINKDVALKGGLNMEIKDPSVNSIGTEDLKQRLETKFPTWDFFIRDLEDFATSEKIGVTIESSGVNESQLKSEIENILNVKLIESKNLLVGRTSPSLGESFYKQMLMTLLIAFLFMAITVFLIYRKIIPSLAIVLAPILNTINTIAFIDLAGFRVSDATIAALLLMIGYSVDTDVLLTTKVLKTKEGSVFQRMLSSFKTGITMTSASVVSLFLAFLVAKSFILKEMFIILIIGP